VKIMIDVGHGGTDPGAVANGLRESDVNLVVAKAARERLRQLRPSAQVRLTREDDRSLAAQQRLKLVRDFAPDICISVHQNSAANTAAVGAEVFYASGDVRGKELAELIGKHLKVAKRTWRGAKTKVASNGRDYYYMIRDVNNAKTVAMLSEGAFLSNPVDAQWLKTGGAEQQGCGIADAIAELMPEQTGPAVVYEGRWYSAQIIDGTTWCPVRAVAEAASLRVEYDAKTKVTTLRR
jgi:N-acetylmuramoyl-L-alanine amidase